MTLDALNRVDSHYLILIDIPMLDVTPKQFYTTYKFHYIIYNLYVTNLKKPLSPCLRRRLS